jgi:hypothetical protein
MPNHKLIRRGFQIIPVFGVLDLDTNIEEDGTGAMQYLPDGKGALALFEERWPETFAGIERDFLKQRETEATVTQLAQKPAARKRPATTRANPKKTRSVKTVGQTGGVTALEVNR